MNNESSINAGIESLRNTASLLKNKAKSIDDSRNSINNVIQSMIGRDWNEETGGSITEDFEQSSKNINVLCSEVEALANALNSIADQYEKEQAMYQQAGLN